MIKIKNDLTGAVIGEFTVLNRHENDYIYPNGRADAQWNIKHKCGKEFIAIGQYVKSGKMLCECMKPKCTYDLSGEYGIGYTNKHEEFWFDLEDYEKIKNFYWWYDSVGYVHAWIEKKHVRLHRFIMNATDASITVDHIRHPPGNQHKVDNRKSNLRLATKSQNNMNSHKRRNNTSGVIGVYWNNTKQRWTAEIQIDSQPIRIGTFINKDDAIKARQEAERKYFGKFSLNQNNNMEEKQNGK